MKGKILMYVGMVSIIIGCRSASTEKESLIVSLENTSFNSDVITAEDNAIVFTYDTLKVNFYFDFPDTIGGFNPKCLIDSFTITFYNEKDGKIKFVRYDGGHTLDSLHFETNIVILPRKWTEAKIDIVPSWLKAFYNPIYDMHKNNPYATPNPLKTRAHYKIFAHEINTRRNFITEFDISVVFANFAD